MLQFCVLHQRYHEGSFGSLPQPQPILSLHHNLTLLMYVTSTYQTYLTGLSFIIRGGSEVLSISRLSITRYRVYLLHCHSGGIYSPAQEHDSRTLDQQMFSRTDGLIIYFFFVLQCIKVDHFCHMQGPD